MVPSKRRQCVMMSLGIWFCLEDQPDSVRRGWVRESWVCKQDVRTRVSRKAAVCVCSLLLVQPADATGCEP